MFKMQIHPFPRGRNIFVGTSLRATDVYGTAGVQKQRQKCFFFFFNAAGESCSSVTSCFTNNRKKEPIQFLKWKTFKKLNRFNLFSVII